MLSVEEQPIEPSGSAEAMEGVTTGAEVGPSVQKTGEAGPAPVVYDLESFRRIPALQKMLEGTLQQTLKKCSYETVAPCFPWLAMRSPDALKAKVEEMREAIMTKTMDEFKKIMESRDLYRKLEEMDQMVDKATERKNAGGNPTTGSRLAPDSAIRASTVPLKRAEIQRLQAQVREVESANTTMVGEIEEGELYISETRQELDSIKAQMKEVSEVLGTVDADQLQTLIEELTGTSS